MYKIVGALKSWLSSNGTGGGISCSVCVVYHMPANLFSRQRPEKNLHFPFIRILGDRPQHASSRQIAN